MSLEERLSLVEFKQELLFENTGYARLLFEHDVTREQSRAISDVFSAYRDRIDDNEEVFHGSFEQAIYDIVPQCYGNYHFVEFLAQQAHKEGRYEEVFEKLYGEAQKFKSYMDSTR
jgi:hypothetical protein